MGFSEGNIGQNVPDNPAEELETVEVSNCDDILLENIFILNAGDDKVQLEDNIVLQEAVITAENKEHTEETTKKNDKEETKNLEKNSERRKGTKASQENELFKNLIDSNSEGLFAIARSLELVAESNNNIAQSNNNIAESIKLLSTNVWSAKRAFSRRFLNK